MYKMTDEGRFIVEDYNWKVPFSNFFPGIAGKYGVQMWVFYVSRNQGICSFGVRDKNHQVLEFLSFNKALEFVGIQGFRTFYRFGDGTVYEPFRKTRESGIHQTLEVSSFDLVLRETNRLKGLETTVTYYSLTGTLYPGLVRKLEIKNIGRRKAVFSLADGLPRVIPYGVDLANLQTIARHIEGMMETVYRAGFPLYRLKQTAADSEVVGEIQGGNYVVHLDGNSRPIRNSSIADPKLLFGDSEVFEFPWKLKDVRAGRLLSSPQVLTNKTPSAFFLGERELKPGETVVLNSLFGYARDNSHFDTIVREVSQRGFLETKREENWKLIESIGANALTVSGNPRFDRYVKQSFLDNVVRGGMPEVFRTHSGKTAFYLYSRQNGDLERDYHFFILEPTPYSQGTGHYRSVNQNRRCDTTFFPQTEDLNVRLYMNLIQLDGWNPIEVNQLTYTLVDRKTLQKELKPLLKKNFEKVADFLERGSFSPGELLLQLDEYGIADRSIWKKVLELVLGCSEENECGGIHEGYWVDHWFYNLDLIDNFLSIYPDRRQQLLFGKKDYYFFDNEDVVRPRDEKYVYVEGRGVRQYHSVYRDREKQKLILSRKKFPRRVRDRYGKGRIYYTDLFVKLFCLAVNRLATIDPEGTGLEMEADKPGWNDSMNGLPGILGSSTCEMFELERLLKFLIESSRTCDIDKVKVYEELADFAEKLKPVMVRRNKSRSKPAAFRYWDESHSLKERYRLQTRLGVSGQERSLPVGSLISFLEEGLKVVRRVYDRANERKVFDEKGVPYTYFQNKVEKFEYIRDRRGEIRRSPEGYPLVRALSFRQEPLPLFLEGPVHFIRVNPSASEKVLSAVRNSRLWDRKLKMYKVCESLADAPFEIGRVKAWGPGWIENESVYTHMLYKYLLEIIRSGQYDRFYKDIETMFMFNLPPERYGRSPFENVSFIVSSAFPDRSMHGRGLQPRLSGVTGEMVHIWTLMTAGPEPFRLDEKGDLVFGLEPALHKDLFTKKPRTVTVVDNLGRERIIRLGKNSFLFRFLGTTDVIYRNPARRSTFGVRGVRPIRYELQLEDGTKFVEEGPALAHKLALLLRSGRVSRMIVDLGLPIPGLH